MAQTRDHEIGAIAAKQRNLITTQQLQDIGFKDSGISDRASAGKLTRVLRGVYLVGVPLLDDATFRQAALLSTGANAAFVDEASAAIHRLLSARPGIVTIGVPGLNRRRSLRTDVDLADGGRGLLNLRGATFPDDETEIVGDARTTTVARTLLNLARFENQQFDRAWREALYRDVLLPAQVEAVLRRKRRDGAPRLRRKLREEFFVDVGDHGIDSPDEYDFVQIVCRAGAPAPLVNHWIRVGSTWRRLDLYWPEAKLAVELLRWRAHRSRESFEDDPVRAAELNALGILTLAFTDQRIAEQPTWCAEQVLRQLAERTKR